MTSLLGLGVAIQIGVCAAVGVRLLRLARRTGQAPERAFGLAYLLLGALGFPLSIPARSGALDPGLAGALLVVAFGAQNVAAACLMYGTARTFHAGRRLALGAVALGAAGLAGSLIAQGATVGFQGGRDGGGAYWVGYALRFGAFLWAGAVSFATARRLRRRCALGLADPVTVDRIRLFAGATLGVCGGFAIFGAARAAGLNAATEPAVLAVTSLVAVGSSAAMMLAFFPPDAYVRRVRRRARTG